MGFVLFQMLSPWYLLVSLHSSQCQEKVVAVRQSDLSLLHFFQGLEPFPHALYVPTLLGCSPCEAWTSWGPAGVESCSVRMRREPRDEHPILFLLEKEGLRRYRGPSSGPNASGPRAQISQFPVEHLPPFLSLPSGHAFSSLVRLPTFSWMQVAKYNDMNVLWTLLFALWLGLADQTSAPLYRGGPTVFAWPASVFPSLTTSGCCTTDPLSSVAPGRSVSPLSGYLMSVWWALSRLFADACTWCRIQQVQKAYE